jgi:hypothetical protein
VIEARLAQLSPEARDLVGVAATIGREFTFDVLALAHGADEETAVRALDELWRRRIVREQGAEVAGLMAAMESYDSVIDMADTARTFGVELTPLEMVAGRMFGGAGS